MPVRSTETTSSARIRASVSLRCAVDTGLTTLRNLAGLTGCTSGRIAKFADASETSANVALWHLHVWPREVVRALLQPICDRHGWVLRDLAEVRQVEDDRRLHSQLLSTSGQLHATHAAALEDDVLTGPEVRALKPLVQTHLRAVHALDERLVRADATYGERVQGGAG